MTHARRVCDDCICDERRLGALVSSDTRLPASFQHLTEHVSFSTDVTGFDAGEAGDQAGILDNVRHELCRVSTQGIELEASGADEVFKDGMSRDADAVIVVALQSASKGEERLYIASAACDLDHDVQSRWWRRSVRLWKVDRVWYGRLGVKQS